MKPTKNLIKEVPFLKNNPREKEIEISAEDVGGPKVEEVKTEKQRKIEELKRNLLAPMNAPSKNAPMAVIPGCMNKINRDDN